MPPLGFFPSPPPPRRLAPRIPLTGGAGVQFHDHRVGFLGQFQLGRGGPSCLRVQLGPHLLSPLTLTPGFAMQRADRQLHPAQMPFAPERLPPQVSGWPTAPLVPPPRGKHRRCLPAPRPRRLGNVTSCSDGTNRVCVAGSPGRSRCATFARGRGSGE
jgi:hypothetical protein